MDTEKLNQWLGLLANVGVIAGILFLAIEIQQNNELMESQTLLELYNTYQTPEYVRGTRAILEIADNLPPDEIGRLLEGENGDYIQQVLLTFEGVGVLVFRGDIAIDWVDEMFRFNILLTWEKLGPYILQQREMSGYSGTWEWNQWLAERLQQRSSSEDTIPAYERYSDWNG